MIQMPKMIKWKNRRLIEPTFVSVVDINSPEKRSPAGPAIEFMKSYGLQVAFSKAFVESIGLDKTNLAVKDQESVYMTHDELKAEGYHAMSTANMNSLKSLAVVQDSFLNHPTFGKVLKIPSDLHI